MKNFIKIIFIFFTLINWSQIQVPGSDQTKSILLYNAKIVSGLGTVIDNGYFGFDNGIIRRN